MTTPWRKAFRDLWIARGRTVLLVATISIGAAAFIAVLSTYAVLTRELEKGYLASNPASAIVHADAIDDSIIAAVRSNPAVGEAEPRRVVFASIKTGPLQWRKLLLVAVQDYQNVRVSRFVPEGGRLAPGDGRSVARERRVPGGERRHRRHGHPQDR